MQAQYILRKCVENTISCRTTFTYWSTTT
jgi:hypothetical protein